MLRGIATVLVLLLLVPLSAGCSGSAKPEEKPTKGEFKSTVGQPLPPPPPLKKG